jgi:hypothetical protein
MPSAVDRFLAAITAAAIDTCDAWADDCVLDATVPNWRFHRRGPAAIRAEYRQWFAYPNTLDGMRRWVVPDGEIVEYLHTFAKDGVRHAAHHLHVLQLRGGLIVADTVFCGGQWSADQLAEMAASDHAAVPTVASPSRRRSPAA